MVDGPTISDLANETMMHIQSHDKYFCRALDMIPRQLTMEPNLEEHINTKYFKHRKVALTSEEKKARSKAEKRARYDPAASKAPESQTVAEPAAAELYDENETETSQSYAMDLLREKLRKKIENMSAQRNENSKRGMKRKFAAEAGALDEQEKKNRAKDLHGKHRKVEETTASSDDGPAGSPSKAQLTLPPPALSMIEEGDFLFSGITDGNGPSRTPGKPGSKTNRLKAMLKQAEAKQHRLQKLRETDHEQLTKVQFEDALSNAMGEKVFDDPKKLKKAIKRREKTKEKSAKTWQARLDEVSAQKDQRAQKRNDNISKRKQPKATPITTPATPKNAATSKDDSSNKSKKPRRAGFEGKKTDFLNSKK